MLTLITLLLSPFMFYFDRTKHKLFFFVIIIFLLGLTISYDTVNSIFNQKEVFEKGTPKLEFEFWFILVETVAVFSLFYIIQNKYYIGDISFSTTKYDFKKLIKIYYGFSILSLLAFTFNMVNVITKLTLTGIFINPRLYEKVFGSYTVINYLYFLNIPALCLSIFIHKNNNKIKFHKLINTLLVLISFFHGIKFTIFDTILFPAIFLYYYNVRFSLKPILSIFFILFSVYIFFNFFIRGNVHGYNIFDQVLSYITPNFYNFFYSVEKAPDQFTFFTDLVLPDKFPKFLQNVSFKGVSGFILNEKYNMQTILADFYLAFSIFAPFLFLPYLLFALFFYVHRNKNIYFYFLAVYFIFCLFFAFFFNAFTKTKYLYFIATFIFIHLNARVKHSE